MNRKELIEIAKVCGTGDCPDNCIYRDQLHEKDWEGYMFCMENLITDLVNALETATPVGEWIEAAAYNDGVINTVYCSVCNYHQPIACWDWTNYCPECGAKMVGAENG